MRPISRPTENNGHIFRPNGTEFYDFRIFGVCLKREQISISLSRGSKNYDAVAMKLTHEFPKNSVINRMTPSWAHPRINTARYKCNTRKNDRSDNFQGQIIDRLKKYKI